jgi:DNA-directed RNA polymerase subunit RPC12/RpoP
MSGVIWFKCAICKREFTLVSEFITIPKKECQCPYCHRDDVYKLDQKNCRNKYSIGINLQECERIDR